MYDVQVEGVLRWERRWGKGVTVRCYDDKLPLVGGRWDEGSNREQSRNS